MNNESEPFDSVPAEISLTFASVFAVYHANVEVVNVAAVTPIAASDKNNFLVKRFFMFFSPFLF